MKKILILLLLIGTIAKGQTFTQQTKEYNCGSFTNNGSYTASVTFTAGDSLHLTPNGFVLFSYGNNFAYVNYPILTWVTTYQNGQHQIVEDKTNFELTETWGYTKLAEKKPHRITFMRNDLIKRLLIDSVLIGTQSTLAQTAFTANFYLSTNRQDMKLDGVVTGFKFSATYVVGLEVQQPLGVVDSNEYPRGYLPYTEDWTNVPDPKTQLASMQAPVFKSNLWERNSLCVEMKYFSGFNPNKVNDYNKISSNGKSIATILATKFNCGFRVCSNINSWYSDHTRNQYSFDEQIMDTARHYPNIIKDWGSALVQDNDIPPYIAAELDQATASTPLDYFSGTRMIHFLQSTLLRQTLIDKGISIIGMRMFEDREGLHDMGGGITGTQIFNRNYNYMLDSGCNLFPDLYKTGYDIYDMSTTNANGLVWNDVLNMTNTNRGTINVYTTAQKYWRKTVSVNRGITFYTASKAGEIATGNKTNTPFVSAGWSMTVENNMQPSNWAGELGIMMMLGVDFYYPSYFTTGGNVQEPKSYTYIPVMPAYVQSVVSASKIANIIKNGELVQGTSGLYGDYNIWSGSIEIYTTARHIGNDYVIHTTNQKTNIYKYLNGRNKQINPKIAGTLVSIETTPQGRFYYWNKAEPFSSENPKRISGALKSGHPYNWVQTFANEE